MIQYKRNGSTEHNMTICECIKPTGSKYYANQGKLVQKFCTKWSRHDTHTRPQQLRGNISTDNITYIAQI